MAGVSDGMAKSASTAAGWVWGSGACAKLANGYRPEELDSTT